MTAQIVALHFGESHSAALIRIESATRTLAASALAELDDSPAADESTMYDEMMALAERIAAIGDASERAGSDASAAALLRVENSLRILATALFAEVDDNPARDPSVMHDALVDIAERIAVIADTAERQNIGRRCA